MKAEDALEALKGSQWIWSAENPLDAQNQFAEFRTTFDAEALPARIWLSVDWNYVLYLNGQEIGRGQLADYPDHKTVAVYDVEALYPGKNTLAVRAFVPNIDTSVGMVSHPGVLAAVEQAGKVINCSLPITWKARMSRAFHNGPLERVTTEIGFTLCHFPTTIFFFEGVVNFEHRFNTECIGFDCTFNNGFLVIWIFLSGCSGFF